MNSMITILWTWILLGDGHISSTESPFFFSVKGDWSSCKSYCEDHNGRLVVIDTQAKYDRVLEVDEQYHNNIISSSELFIGLYTRTMDCTDYTWVSGSLMSWSKWDMTIQEPNQCYSDLCVRLFNGLFRTTRCTFEFTSLCEYVFPESSSSMTTRKTISSAKPTTVIPEDSSSLTSSSTTIDTRVITNSTTATKIPVMGTPTVRKNTTPVPTAHPTTVYDPCRRKQTNVTQLSQVDLLETLALLKVELTVMKNSTSIARRKKISVYESRSSCLALGGVAAAIISAVIGCIVVPDVITMYMYLVRIANKQNAVNP